MIKTQNLTKVFRTEEVETVALNGVSINVEDGEFVAIMGPSGCGKSTLLNILGLLDNPDSGDYLLDGEPVANLKEKDRTRYRRGRIGFVFQSFNLIDELTVEENVDLQLRYMGVAAKERRERVTEILRKVGLSHRAKHYPQQLSGGQQQRVAIAGVVAMRPDCLILDEATAMLDPRGREQVMQTIHYLNRNMGITVVSITHYMEEAAQADRVLVMSKGHVVMEGTPKEVFSQTEKVRSLHLDVPQAAELRDELVKAGIPMPEGIIDTGACAQALYELLQ